jgi:hypothetical protein
MEGKEKRRRLAHLSTMASSRNCASLISEVRSGAVDGAAASRAAIQRARADQINVVTPHGTLIQDLVLPCYDTDQPFVWRVCRPVALWSFLCQSSLQWGDALRARIEESPPSLDAPWRIIVYADEAIPGNILNFDDARKSWCVYWSVADKTSSNAEMLCHEDAWHVLGVLRSNVVASVRGGISGVLRAVLLQCFYGDPHVSAGWRVSGQRGAIGPIPLSMAFFLADEDAVKSAWSFKGASGTFPCFRCKNAVAVSSDVWRENDYFVRADNTRLDLFDPHSNDSWYAAADRLRGLGGRGIGRINHAEQSSGLNRDLDTMLYIGDLRHVFGPVSHTCIDFGHIYMTNGVMHFEVEEFMAAFAAATGFVST